MIKYKYIYIYLKIKIFILSWFLKIDFLKDFIKVKGKFSDYCRLSKVEIKYFKESGFFLKY